VFRGQEEIRGWPRSVAGLTLWIPRVPWPKKRSVGGRGSVAGLILGLIRFGGRVNNVVSGFVSLLVDEDHEALGGVGISIRPARVAAVERPTVILGCGGATFKRRRTDLAQG
jgi:hypothetical protein